MITPTVRQNQTEMRDLAVSIMREKYRTADLAAKCGRLDEAKMQLESAEYWRVKARGHGAKV